jgi:predicted ATPase
MGHMDEQGIDHGLRAPLVGRADDSAAIQGMVREGARLITLTGPPGVGKTRLGNAVAEIMARETTDGVHAVPLATVRDVALIAPAVGQVLGVAEIAGQPLAETLVQYLHDKRALLLLDDVDPVAAPVVATLLTAPKLTILATSRTPLRLAGECIYLVPPLALPDHAAVSSATPSTDDGAMHLFITRARAANPAFTLGSDDDTRAVTDVCRLLAGLPLAIELAAARSRSLPPAALLASLHARLPAPPTDTGKLPGYEGTLRATIAWSADLLSDLEQQLFARLAVFVGGCTREAARAVCDVSGSGINVEAGLHTLCDLYLVQRTDTPDGEERFVLLETVRAHAAERLAAYGDEAETWRRYVGYYRTLVEQTDLMLRGPQQVQWLNRLEAELGNLRAILRWAFDRGDAALGLRLAGALDRFWQYHTHVSEGRQWLARGLAMGATAPPVVRAKALSLAGWLARFQDAMEESAALLAEALALYRSLDDRRGIAEVTDTLGDLAHFEGDQERALTLHQRNLALRREIGDRWGVAMTLNSLGWIALAQGDDRRAMMALQESLALARQLGDGRGMAMVLTGLGWVSLDRDDARQAQVCMRESLALFRDLGSKIDICLCIEGLGAVAGMRGAAGRAARLFGAAQALREAMNVDYAPLTERHYARHREAAHTLIGTSAWSAAWVEGRTLSLDQAIDEALGVGATDDSTTARME